MLKWIIITGKKREWKNPDRRPLICFTASTMVFWFLLGFVLSCVRFGLGRFSGLAEISIPAGKTDKGSSESKFSYFSFKVFLHGKYTFDFCLSHMKILCFYCFLSWPLGVRP